MKSEPEPQRGITVMRGMNMTKNLSDQTWYTLAEAKEYTRLSESLLRQHVAKGRLKSTRSSDSGGKLLFHKHWLDELLMRNEVSHD